jgi:hypothetical protein
MSLLFILRVTCCFYEGVYLGYVVEDFFISCFAFAFDSVIPLPNSM